MPSAPAQSTISRRARKKAKELFDMIDTDNSGLLDKDEFKELSKTLTKKFPKIDLVDERGKPLP